MAGDELDQFIEDMLADKALPGLDDPEIRVEMVNNLRLRILDQIDRAVVDAVPEDKDAELNALLDKPDVTDQEIHDFVASCGIDTKRIAVDTMVQFRQLFTASVTEQKA